MEIALNSHGINRGRGQRRSPFALLGACMCTAQGWVTGTKVRVGTTVNRTRQTTESESESLAPVTTRSYSSSASSRTFNHLSWGRKSHIESKIVVIFSFVPGT